MNYQVLLIDDNKIALESMKVTIPWEELGLSLVGCAVNGQEGCRMISSFRPDIVISDIHMPEMDGLEATAAIRALDRPDVKTISILALTANAFDEDVQRSMQAGLNAHLTKPVDPDILFETLEELLSD